LFVVATLRSVTLGHAPQMCVSCTRWLRRLLAALVIRSRLTVWVCRGRFVNS